MLPTTAVYVKVSSYVRQTLTTVQMQLYSDTDYVAGIGSSCVAGVTGLLGADAGIGSILAAAAAGGSLGFPMIR